MPQPGDYVPAPDLGPTAIRLVGPEACGDCGSRPGRGAEGWHYRFTRCTCTPDASGHHSWHHDCGWSLTVPPHDPEYRTPPSYR